MKATHLRTEYLKEPLGLGIARPRLYWQCEGGVTQSAYQITARRNGEVVWDSGRVLTSSMTHIRYEGKTLHSRDRVEWSVTLWDENGLSGETVSSWFELGLLDAGDWKAQWISGDYKPNKKMRYPVDCFRKNFVARGEAVKARLYASARGVYDVIVNGHRVEDFILAPGMTDYRKRIQYQTYDVTGLLEKQNTLELRLADGWFRGSVAAYGAVNVFGSQTSVIAQLELTYADGSTETVCTDDSWTWSNDGPIRFADLKDGEVYDAAKQPSYSGKAKIVSGPKGARLTASDNVPVREQERLSAKLLTARNGARVLDFGQNIAGYLEFDVRGKTGQTFTLICGEVLDKDGHVDLRGIQESRPAKGWGQLSLVKKLITGKVSGEVAYTPMQQVVFTCSGEEDHYKTGFAVFGFRYAEIKGDISIDPTAFTAIAVYSNMEQTGDFKCSDERVNRLLENTRWSMKGNYLDIPTDCPTRERLGWTGDAQIFFDTGAYLMDTSAFFRKWLRDMEDDQYDNGLLSAVVPYQGVEMMYKATGSSVGWADAVYLVPYRYYKRYGDKELLKQCWPMMKKYGDYLMKNLGQTDKKAAKSNPHNAYTYEKGVHLGEWLEPKEFQDKVYGAQAKHPEECTAYLHYAMKTIGKIAELLGDKTYQAECIRYAEGAKEAYNALFVKTGTLDTDRQAKLVRPLALGLLDGEARKATQARLKKAVENYNYRVGTGFLSTPFVLLVLTETGEIDTAYKMLLNSEKPGWLAEVADGATTIWENWEGDLSQNHYSPGAVCQWLFETVGGIRSDGENRFVIAPQPGSALDCAEASYDSLYGTVSCRWERKNGGVEYQITVPANTTANVILPDGTVETVSAGMYTYQG